MDPALLAELDQMRAARNRPAGPVATPAETGALQSLYGAGNEKRARTRRKAQPDASKALAGNAGAADREQTILTPPWIVQRLIELTGPLGLDPCTIAANPLRAPVWCTGPEDGGVDGLAVPWHATASLGFTYVNPPYRYLQAWLDKAVSEAAQGARIWFLGPFRCNRTWFGAALQHAHVTTLDYAVRFIGYKDAYPDRLFLAGWNVPELRTLLDDSGREFRLGRWRFEP